VLNGDDIYETTDLEKLAATPRSLLAIQTTRPLPGAVLTDQNMYVQDLVADASDAEKWCACGAYMLDEEYFNLPLGTISVHGQTEYSLPHTLKNAANTYKIRLIAASRWLPVGTPLELAQTEKILQNI
jgi:NDP-sugar pyrophosphorylase family protein